MANGAIAGEVTTDTAIIWTRLTRHPERNVRGLPFPKVNPQDIPSVALDPRKTAYERNALLVSLPVSEAAQLQGHALDEMEGAVPGAEGDVRVLYWREDQGSAAAIATPRASVSIANDGTHSFQLSGLAPNARYHFRAEGYASGQAVPSCTYEGAFRTAPRPTDPTPLTFTVVTCQDYPRRDDPVNGHRIYPAMARLEPDFFVHTGDFEYLDKPTPLATTVALARFKYNRIMALPFQRAFYSHVSSYFMKDDHDTLKDDAWPGQTYGDLTFAQGLALFREHLPQSDPPYRTIRWGRDLQIWLVEGRDFRSPNDAPDGPQKSIWGVAQKRWFFETVDASDATFRILISPTAVVGPDRDGKGDSHANQAFAHEGAELRQFLASRRMFVINGDRHWQYASVDPATGLHEYGTGPSSDIHASGYSDAERTPAHRYLRIRGGFISVRIARVDGQPRAIIRHHDVDGNVRFEQSETAR
ncbi:alkaline phosphatase [Opitutus sp. ER46]|nr:alkaline phosphatase [Opitutus sp. ER46]